MSTKPSAGLCPPGGCTAREEDRLQRAVALAWQAGRDYERSASTEMDHLDKVWKIPRTTWKEQVAARIADMEARNLAMGPRNPARSPRYDDPTWPPVAVPGGGGVRLGAGEQVMAA